MIAEQPEKENENGNGSGPIYQSWGLREWFEDFLDLREGMDRQGTIKSIVEGKKMRGANAWMLVCSIMIASLGLNLDSAAVIIGAMLISPLMNPILGIGLAVGTNDRDMLWVALRSFGVSIAIALVTSILYFSLTPFDTFTQEMQSRTAPNLLDGLVAIFGGLAGIISVSRADKSNAIPGVAIATALMPPLCVAGYGVVAAVSQGESWTIFLQAFYLFFLNSFFIATTAYIIIRLLRFPYKKYINRKEARQSQMIIGLVSICMIIPGYITMRKAIRNLNQSQAAERFVEDFFLDDCVDYKLIDVPPDSHLLVLQLVDRPITLDSIAYFNQVLTGENYRLPNASIRVIQDNSLNLERLDRMQYELNTLDDLETKLSAIEESNRRAVAKSERVENQLSTYRMDTTDFLRFTRQLMLAFPEVRNVRLARAQSSGKFGPDDEPPYRDNLPLVVLDTEPSTARQTRRQREEEGVRLQEYLQTSLKVDTVVVIKLAQ
ncbi:DUF389 domain-containing protein [Lewinella sp. W8]|uniref:DUF389 domain-containing protein n=1 Tax=Lewinella sp. W8 TaxID=2528208 RepID=UPI0010672C64|nr:DUF389 domain-containing protein [Lewinella sp. W8]